MKPVRRRGYPPIPAELFFPKSVSRFLHKENRQAFFAPVLELIVRSDFNFNFPPDYFTNDANHLAYEQNGVDGGTDDSSLGPPHPPPLLISYLIDDKPNDQSYLERLGSAFEYLQHAQSSYQSIKSYTKPKMIEKAQDDLIQQLSESLRTLSYIQPNNSLTTHNFPSF